MEERKLLKRKEKALKTENKNSLATTCMTLGGLYINAERYEDAINEFKISSNIYEQIEKKIDYALANRMIGEAFMHLGEYDKALKHQQIYLNLSREENCKLEEQRALATIGHIYLTSYLNIIDNPNKEPLQLADDAFMKSLDICKSLTGINKYVHKDMETRLLGNLGVVKECMGNIDEAISLVEKSINTCEEHDLFEQLERNYTFLGSIYAKNGEYDKAIQYYNLAIEVAERLKNKVTLIHSSLLAKADIHIKLADYYSAKTVLLRAYKLKTENINEHRTIERNLKVVVAMCNTEIALLTSNDFDHKNKKCLYEKLGDGACSLKSYKYAIQYYHKMLEEAENNGESGLDLSPCYNSLAETYRDDKQFDMAIKYFKIECDISKNKLKQSDVASLLNIADCMESAGNDSLEIETIYKQARYECRIGGDKYLESKILLRHISMLVKHNKTVEALQLDQELRGMEIMVSDSDSEQSEQAIPDIGHDISINDITDISDASDIENIEKPRAVCKRKKGLVIKRNNKGETQLHTACISGNIALVKQLLDRGHVVNVKDNCGWLPIHEACICGHLEIVKMLINKGALVNDRGGALCNGMTPLHDAASNGHLEIMQLLLENGASSTGKNDNGETPLHVLKRWGNIQNIDISTNSFYNDIVQRLTKDLEKLGYSKDDTNISSEINTALINENRKEPIQRNSTDNSRQVISYDLELSDSELSNLMISDHKNNINTPDKYKRVMRNLKNLNHNENTEKKRKSNENRLRSAYFETNEVGDDWLENDMCVNQSKKRKTSSAEGFINSSGIRKRSSNSLERPCSSSSSTLREKSNSPIQFSDQDLNTILNADSDSEFKHDRCNSRQKRKKQTSLIASGFTRSHSFSPKKSTTVLVSNSGCTTTNLKHQSKIIQRVSLNVSELNRKDLINENFTSQLNNVFNSEPTLSIDVRINEKLYRVPVPASEIHTRTIKWLAEEAAIRYGKKECMKPTLELETKNGAILAEDDSISILFSAGITQAEEVEAKILKYNLLPLCDRYTEACRTTQIEPKSQLLKILQTASTTLDLSNLNLETKYMAPFYKSITKQYNLHSLILSGNFMQNESIELLCAALPFMENLTTLNLSLNQLTSVSLQYLSEMLIQSPKTILENLISLDLSYNSLKNESLRYLSIITRYLKLQTLNLVDVDFGEDIFNNNLNVYLCLDYIKNFDISYNKLTKKEVSTFLSWLKPWNVETLNISNNLSVEEGLIKEVINWLLNERGSVNLYELNLARCCATDEEILELAEVLVSSSNFKSLNLSHNENITSLSFQRLLSHPNCLKLTLYGCMNALKYLQDDTKIVINSKELKLSVDCKQYLKEKDIVISMWKIKYKEKSLIEELQNIVELSII